MKVGRPTLLAGVAGNIGDIPSPPRLDELALCDRYRFLVCLRVGDGDERPDQRAATLFADRKFFFAVHC